MTEEAVRLMSKELIVAILEGNRLDESYKKGIQKAQHHFFIWSIEQGYPDIRKIGKKELVQYHTVLAQLRSKRTGERLASSTINSRYHAVSMIFSVLYKNGILEKNPCHGLHLDIREVDGYKRRPMTRAEVTEFLENIDITTEVGLRDRTLFELIYSSGLRVSEAVTVKIEDIDFLNRQIIVRGKFDRERVVPVSKVARDFLLMFLGERIQHRQGAVFAGNRGISDDVPITSSYISERFKYLLRKFDMDKKEISTHSIRHSTATHLLENGASIRHVQELLGHKSIQATVRYTQLQIESIQKVYRKYHPRENHLYERIDDSYNKRLEKLSKQVEQRKKKNVKKTYVVV